MADIWANLSLPNQSDEWVYKLAGEVRGPIPKQAMVEKLLAGDIGFDTVVGRDGGQFYPIGQVKAFAPHLKEAQKRAAKRLRHRRIKLALLLLIPVGAVAGGGVYLVSQRVAATEAAKKADEQAARAAIDAKRKAYHKAEKLELLAVVDLGTAADVKIGNSSTKTGRSTKRRGGKKSSAPQKTAGPVAQCGLSQTQIFSTVKKAGGKINACVQLVKNSGTTLPPKIGLDWIVKTDGKVVEFGIQNRELRTGVLRNCLFKTFASLRFPKSTGTTCPTSIQIGTK